MFFVISLIIVKNFVVHKFDVPQKQLETVDASTLNLIRGCAPVPDTFVFR